MRYQELLNERYEDIGKALEPFKNDPTIYVTYMDDVGKASHTTGKGKPSSNTSGTKFGINPRSTFNTPLGIYSYPLDVTFKQAANGGLPFAQDRPFVQVFRAHGRIIDLATYSESEFRRDCETLRKHFAHMLPEEVEWDELVERSWHYAIHNSWGGRMWYLTYYLANAEPIKKGRKPPVLWSSIFRLMGWDGAVDRAGHGIIHENEPTQAVFFNIKALQLLKTLPNVQKYDSRPPRLVLNSKHITSLSDLTNVMFYYDPDDDDRRDYNYTLNIISKEWLELLKTGKSAHLTADLDAIRKALEASSFWSIDMFVSHLLTAKPTALPSVIQGIRELEEFRQKDVANTVLDRASKRPTPAARLLFRKDVRKLLGDIMGIDEQEYLKKLAYRFMYEAASRSNDWKDAEKVSGVATLQKTAAPVADLIIAMYSPEYINMKMEQLWDDMIPF